MAPLSGFEARFAFALALFGSALLHAGALLVAGSATRDEARDEARVEVVMLDAREEPAPADGEAPGEPAPAVATDALEAAAAPAEVDPSTVDPSRLHWRARLALREAEHRRDMAVKARRVAALERAVARAPRHEVAADPGEVYACGAHAPGRRVEVGAERDVSGYAGVLPSGLFPSRYVEGMREVGASGARRGRFLFALPAEVLPIALDAPRGALLAAGRDDARCLVGVDFSPAGFFPLRFRGVPVRVVDERDRVTSALVDVRLYDDATFDLVLVEGGPLPFTRGALYDHEAVGRNLRQHYVGARALRDLAGLLLGE